MLKNIENIIDFDTEMWYNIRVCPRVINKM